MKTLCVESMAGGTNKSQHQKTSLHWSLRTCLFSISKLWDKYFINLRSRHTCTGIVCKTCFDLVVCHICHICPSVERCTKHSVLCSVRKLFGTTDPGLDTDQRFIGASTWWGDELTSWRVVSVVFVFFWVWTVWKASHGYHWTKCNQPFFVETCWDIQWECLMDESKVCERKHCVRELAMWSKMGELHGHLRLCFRPAANGCNTGSRRLLKTAPGREFKGNQGLVIWKLRLNSERHGIRQSSQVRELFVTVLILLAISQQKWFCLYKHLESLESQVPNNLPSSPCFTQA